MITLTLVDDEELFLNGLKELLNNTNEFDVLHTYNSPTEFVSNWKKLYPKPDVVLMDINMPKMDGIELTHFVLEASPEVKVIGLSSHYTKSLVFNMLQIGASGYLPKNVNIKRLTKTIRQVHEEGFYFDDFRLKGLHSHDLSKKEQRELLFHGLTSREVEVLQLICEQCTTYEIGDKLFISTKTVERHRSSLFEKTKSKNVVGLVLFALKYQLVEREFVK